MKAAAIVLIAAAAAIAPATAEQVVGVVNTQTSSPPQLQYKNGDVYVVDVVLNGQDHYFLIAKDGTLVDGWKAYYTYNGITHGWLQTEPVEVYDWASTYPIQPLNNPPITLMILADDDGSELTCHAFYMSSSSITDLEDACIKVEKLKIFQVQENGQTYYRTVPVSVQQPQLTYYQVTNIVPEPVTLSVQLSPPWWGILGHDLKITIIAKDGLTGEPIPGLPVTLMVTGGGLNYQQTFTTPDTGVITVDLKPTQAGVITVQVSTLGNGLYGSKSWSSAVTFKIKTKLNLTVQPDPNNPGAVLISAKLTDENGNPIPNAQIFLLMNYAILVSPNVPQWVTGSDGAAPTLRYKFDQPGIYRFQAMYPGDALHTSAFSKAVVVKVEGFTTPASPAPSQGIPFIPFLPALPRRRC